MSFATLVGVHGQMAAWPHISTAHEWLERYERLDELRELAAGHWDLLAGWLARQCGMRVARLQAELGDEAARRRLRRWLAGLRERAEAGDEHARGFLAENPDWRDFRAEWAD